MDRIVRLSIIAFVAIVVTFLELVALVWLVRSDMLLPGYGKVIGIVLAMGIFMASAYFCMQERWITK